MRRVAEVVDAIRQLEGEGMEVRRSIPNTRFRMLDPFLLLDHMGPTDFGPGEGRGAPDHPHRGFETVTYVLEGKLQHKDSQGNKGDLAAGDVQWMTAGAGVVHSEMPHPELQETGGRMHGLQLWVDLPRDDKMMRPRYQDIRTQDIPEVDVPEGKVRVIAGRFQDVEAIIDTRTPITYLHALLEPGGKVSLPVPEGHNAFTYTIKGTGTVGGHDVREAQLVRLAAESPGRAEGGQAIDAPQAEAAGDQAVAGPDAVELTAGQEGLSVILVTGRPLRQAVFQWGPFVMTSREEIVQAVRDYQAGRMGSIEPEIG